MANQEQLDILTQSVQVWNEWMEKNPKPDIVIDLRNTYLNDANLNGAHLRGANLNGAHLRGVKLNDADLSSADLNDADLSGGHLRNAALEDAYLEGAHLIDADLSGADLKGAYLSGANLIRANLRNADLEGVILWDTIFGDVDLSVVKNLETVKHDGPSTIGIDTIYRSQANIPEMFLRKAGVPDAFIDYMRSLVGKPIDYYSCFISYSSKDEAFAKRLYADL